jgi:glycosyltransferase involved in cell wall biosynthesis
MKGKIGESLSLGVPVVTTKIGAEGLELTDGDNVLLAENNEEFAQKVTALYRNVRFWSSLSRRGQATMRKFSPDNVADQLQHTLARYLKEI